MSAITNNPTVQKNEKPLDLTRSDVFLCVSNVTSVASTILVKAGLNGILPLVARDFSPIAIAVGEIWLGGQNETNMETFKKLALVYSRLAIANRLEKIPLFKPFVFAGYVIGTVGIVKRAFEQINENLKLVDPKGENNLKIARNVFVHGVNASAASYRTAGLLSSTFDSLRSFFSYNSRRYSYSTPTSSPTYRPSSSPTYRPSSSPTYRPSSSPTYSPTSSPTYRPTGNAHFNFDEFEDLFRKAGGFSFEFRGGRGGFGSPGSRRSTPSSSPTSMPISRQTPVAPTQQMKSTLAKIESKIASRDVKGLIDLVLPLEDLVPSSLTGKKDYSALRPMLCSDSTKKALKKCLRDLSLLIHPDKVAGELKEKATSAMGIASSALIDD